MAFITITVIIFQSYTDQLAHLIRNPSFSKPNKITKDTLKWNESYEEHLKECIQLHQEIRKYVYLLIYTLYLFRNINELSEEN